jgi:putative aminopeptidase FrvX
MSTALLDHLHQLSAVWGPSGREQRVADLLQTRITPYVDEVKRDHFGNLIATKRGPSGAKRVMISAHMDTVGAVALNVSENGLIHVAPVGDFKAYNAMGQRVLWGSGTVGILQHEAIADSKEIAFTKLWCDIGATSKEEALAQVQLGDICVLTGDCLTLGDYLVGPALDNRAGCAVLLAVAAQLSQTNHEVIYTFTCQGEVGPRGAGVAAFGVAPDLALIVDVATSGDLPRAPRLDVKLGKGPALKLKDGNYMAHHHLSAIVRGTALESAIPLQTEIVATQGGQNDGQVIAISGPGIPTAVLDIPARYRGTAGEMIHTADLFATVDLLLKLMSSPLNFA